jgi:hypothetical protein
MVLRRCPYEVQTTKEGFFIAAVDFHFTCTCPDRSPEVCAQYTCLCPERRADPEQ